MFGLLGPKLGHVSLLFRRCAVTGPFLIEWLASSFYGGGLGRPPAPNSS
jgi:hypothetical protein